MADVFDPDLEIALTGRARFKLSLYPDALAYVRWIPKDFLESALALVAGGAKIPSYAWHEFDFTVTQGDKINIRFSPAVRVTVSVYNIGWT